MKIDFLNSPNFSVGRKGNQIKGFILHTTEGSFRSAIEWCMNEKSQVSYHYIVNKNGEITQLVENKDTAWHAGLMKNPSILGELYTPNPNTKTIGIAFAGIAEIGPSFEQIKAICELLRELSLIHNIKLDKNTVIKHNDVRADKNCPGNKVNIEAILYLCSTT